MGPFGGHRSEEEPMVTLPTQTLRLPSTLSSPAAARHFVRRSLVDIHDGDTADAAVLLTSELVTNAVLHGSSFDEVGVEVRLDLVDHRIHVAVNDCGPAMPVVRPWSREATSGRGIGLVETLASAWGVAVAPSGGKSVWFVLDF
jgi:anti-sigma regulatory factor (Ser/Thr protein kinase)